MARFKQGDNVDQGFRLPLSMRDWLPEDHLAWFIMDAVDALDVDVLLDSYRVSGKGELPYDPRMMLRVLIYAYATGTFSSRRIEKQLHDSIAFRVLAGNQSPGFRSISRFRARHIEHFSGNCLVEPIRPTRASRARSAAGVRRRGRPIASSPVGDAATCRARRRPAPRSARARSPSAQLA